MTILEQGNGAAPQAAPDLIKETTTQAFVKDVIEESKRQPVLIDFWAPWCGPCRIVSPVVERIATDLPGKLKLVKVNSDNAPNLSQRFGIRGIPTLVMIDHGKEVARITGAYPEPALRSWVDEHLPKPAAKT